jgi:signal transduction histidine kinase
MRLPGREAFMKNGRLREWLIVGAPIAALILCGFLGAMAYVFDVSRTHDRAAAARETRLLGLAVQRETQAVGLYAEEYAAWDDAYAHIVERFDPSWADSNFYPVAFDHLIVTDGAGAVIYERSAPAMLEEFGPRLRAAQLIGARAAELAQQARRAYAHGQPSVQGLEVAQDGALISVSVTMIRPAEGPPTSANPRYLFVINRFGETRLDALAASADIKSVCFDPGKDHSGLAKYLTMPIVGADGSQTGALVWEQSHPGAAVVASRAPWLAAFFLALGIAAGLVIRAQALARIRAADEARMAAEAANVAKSQFLAMMSHELRTPLHAIIGYSEIMLEDAANTDEGARHDLGRVHAASHHLLSLVNDILDLSKVESGALEANIKTIDLHTLLNEVSATAKPLFIPGDTRFVTANDSGLVNIRTDARFLRQILINLLGNAAKFTNKGAVSLRIEQAGDKIAFRVIDTGIGMNSETLAKLFTPFHQADSSTTRRFGGTGLGLALSRKLAHLLGAEIEVESAPGRGSTFSLVFARSALLADEDSEAA